MWLTVFHRELYKLLFKSNNTLKKTSSAFYAVSLTNSTLLFLFKGFNTLKKTNSGAYAVSRIISIEFFL